jgi:periplasmic protein TonB
VTVASATATTATGNPAAATPDGNCPDGAAGTADAATLDMPALDVPMSGSGPFLGAFGQVDRTEEGDIVPLVRIQPQYPRDAAMNQIEGWVRIEFTIDETGSVRSPRVIEARPPRVFDREAIRAILRWKFKPRIVDGVAVPRQATQTIEFSLDET